MGMTIECYSAEPQAILALFAARNASGDLDSFFEKLETYPVVDFSFHLHIPEDLDSLCQALRKHNGLVPPTFRELFVEHVWYDGLAESLTLLNKTFTLALAGMSASEIE